MTFNCPIIAAERIPEVPTNTVLHRHFSYNMYLRTYLFLMLGAYICSKGVVIKDNEKY